MVQIWFLDTNVIASWVIAESTLLDHLSDEYHFPEGYRELYLKKFHSEVDLINTIISTDNQYLSENNEFYISFLTTNELFSAIRDEIVSLILFNKGEPISRWPGLKSSVTLRDDQTRLIYETTLQKMGELMLLTTAILNSADVFITRDEHLITSCKTTLKNNYDIEIMKPETARLALNHQKHTGI